MRIKVGKNAISAAGAMMILGGINNERSVLRELHLDDVLVEKEFETEYSDILQSRPDLKVHHGGLLSNYIITGAKWKPRNNTAGDNNDLNDDESKAMLALDEFLRNDPIAIIKSYVEKNNLRLLDFFNQFDKSKEFKITPEDLKKGVKQASIGLSDEKIDAMVAKLDANEKDGKIDYSELVFGKDDMMLKKRKLEKRLKAIMERKSSRDGRMTRYWQGSSLQYLKLPSSPLSRDMLDHP